MAVVICVGEANPAEARTARNFQALRGVFGNPSLPLAL